MEEYPAVMHLVNTSSHRSPNAMAVLGLGSPTDMELAAEVTGHGFVHTLRTALAEFRTIPAGATNIVDGGYL